MMKRNVFYVIGIFLAAAGVARAAGVVSAGEGGMAGAPPFDGRASTVAVKAAGRQLEQATVHFLISPDARQQDGFISIFSHDGWAQGMVHILLNNGSVNFCVNGMRMAGGGQNDFHTRVRARPGQWSFVAITYDAKARRVTCFRNGLQVDQCALEQAPPLDFGHAGHLGSWEGRSRFFTGRLAGFVVEDAVLAEAEIRRLAAAYNLMDTPKPPRAEESVLPETRRAVAAAGAREIVFVKRRTYDSNHYYTEYINSSWMPGSRLCVLDVATGAVRDVVPQMAGGVFERFDVSFDARRIVFAWKGKHEEGYRLYEVNADGTGLRQLTFPQADEADLVAKYRKYPHYHHGTDDLQPCYLPDGGIAFVSTRCQYGILCDGPDDFTTTVLFRMDADGANMRQLSRSSVSETGPSMLPDGRILYTRWEYVDKGAVSVKCLWAMRPDGTASSEVFGNDVALPPTLNFGRAVPGAPNLYVVAGVPHCPQNNVGTVILLDMTKPIRTREPMTYLTPQVDIRAEPGFAFREDDGDPWQNDGGGRGDLFANPYPLSADLFLVSHKPAELGDWKAPAGYGLYALDAKGAVRLLHRDADTSCWHPIPLAPRPVPPVLSTALDNALAAKNQAVCMVRDVYHGLVGVPRGTVKHLRVLEQVPRPWAAQCKGFHDEYDQQHIAITKDTHLGLKVQHGIVPVEADGSAHFTVPANANIFLQALDEHHMAVQTERTFVNYMPGETRACIGCHETPESASAFQNEQKSAGQPAAFARKPSAPSAQPGEARGQRPLHYETDVQPVLDKHCARCHSGAEPKGKLNLSGERTRLFNVSYESLVPERRKGRDNRDRGLLGQVIGENHPKTGNVHYLPAWSLGSPTSLLAAIIGSPTRADDPRGLVKKHADVAAKVTPEERLRVTNWIDTNAQYYGTWWFRRNTDIFRDHPDLRRAPTFDDAVRMTEK
ncbi:MAG: hypothetical protein FWG50_00620 [Kiritimatiellaeota bacterium]|nr:hypothetical protein [Kiritimatiellota bacterium]